MPLAPDALQHLITRAEALITRLEAVLPHPLEAPDWSASVAFRYRKRAGGSRLEPVRHVAHIRLDNLVEVEPQKERLLRNTAQFVGGHPANNVLLTGARGTGKSSLIKACLNEFAPQGLRLIEVDKADLVDLPDLTLASPEYSVVGGLYAILFLLALLPAFIVSLYTSIEHRDALQTDAEETTARLARLTATRLIRLVRRRHLRRLPRVVRLPHTAEGGQRRKQDTPLRDIDTARGHNECPHDNRSRCEKHQD